jgi:hypothetical protein
MSRIGILRSGRSGDLISASRQTGFHLIRMGGAVGSTREVRDHEDALANMRNARVPRERIDLARCEQLQSRVFVAVLYC